MNINITDDHLRIIQLLRRDPRKSFLEISRITGIPLERIFELYAELKNNGIIKNITIIDIYQDKIINVFLIFTPTINQHKILSHLRRDIHVNSISLTDREFIVHSSFFNLDEYNSFIDDLENLGVECIDDYFITEVII
jgi:DNA-binding Lrp family transcriptional regulator